MTSLPLYDTDKIIAPYWAYVDTSGTGKIFYRQTSDPSLLARASREIQTAFPTYQNVTIANLFIATWDAVSYHYGGTDKVWLLLLVYCKIIQLLHLNLHNYMYTHVASNISYNLCIRTFS